MSTRSTQRKCSLHSCSRPLSHNQLCKAHARRLADWGDVRESLPIRSPAALLDGATCAADGCTTSAKARVKGTAYCALHWHRVKRHGVTELPQTPPYPDGNGYLRINVKGRDMAHHRYVMEQHIGRSLLPEETVHHINGVRDDNRIENLELWSSSHPSGQRVADKVAWARQILATYGEGSDLASL